MAVEVHDTVDAVAPEWDELADAVGAPPYLRPGWMRLWWQSFGAGRLVVIAVRGPGGNLRAVLPLGSTGRDIRALLNGEAPHFGAVAADPGAREELYRALFAAAGRSVDLGWLAPIDGAAAAAAAERSGYATRVVSGERAPFVAIIGGWDEYLAALKPDRRRQLERRRRRLGEQGEVGVRIAREPDGLPDFLTLEASGWKGRAGTAIRSRPELLLFYEGVTRWAAERDELRIAFLELDGRPIAGHLYLETKGVLHRVKSGFDERFAKQSPSVLLTAAMLESAFEQRLVLYDFLGGAEAHKLEWSADERPLVMMRAWERASLAGRALHQAETRGRPAAKRAREELRRLRG